MNDQLLRKDTIIDTLSKELEKEREYNREKDRQLIEMFSKLVETQAVLAVGQSVEKQKELAETLIEGHHKMEGLQVEQADVSSDELKKEFHEEPKKHGWLQRVWDVITNK